MQRRRRPRALTLTLPDTSQPCFLLAGQKYTLRNFSEEGIGLWITGETPFAMHAGNRISGDIVIGAQIYPVQLEVAHGSARAVGLRILSKSPELALLFRRLLEPANQAHDLSPERDSGEEDPELGFPRLWYRNRRGTELIVWYHEAQKMIQALQLSWLGKWVFRAQFKPAETGCPLGLFRDFPRWR